MCSRTNNFGNFGKKKPLTIASFSGFWNSQGQCSNWRHRFSCGQLHVCGSNYTSVWTQSPNTLSSISVPTLFCFYYLLHVHVCKYMCICDIKKEPENCVGDVWSVARVDNAVLPSFLLSHSPPGNNNGKTVSFVHLSIGINSRQMKYFVLSYWIRNLDLKVITTAVPSLKKSVKTSSSGEKEFKRLYSSQSWFLNV